MSVKEKIFYLHIVFKGGNKFVILPAKKDAENMLKNFSDYSMGRTPHCILYADWCVIDLRDVAAMFILEHVPSDSEKYTKLMLKEKEEADKWKQKEDEDYE